MIKLLCFYGITIFIHIIYLLKHDIYAYILWLKAILYSKFFEKRIFLYNQNAILKGKKFHIFHLYNSHIRYVSNNISKESRTWLSWISRTMHVSNETKIRTDSLMSQKGISIERRVIKRKRPRKLITGHRDWCPIEKSWVQGAKWSIPNKPNSKNLVPETQISRCDEDLPPEERRGLPTYARYKIRYLRVLRHLHMHTDISARGSRENRTIWQSEK